MELVPLHRELLDEFFAPFNRQLARELGDDRFLWRTPSVDAASAASSSL
jgi:hypothetical protein